jgi:hypothetical protein
MSCVSKFSKIFEKLLILPHLSQICGNFFENLTTVWAKFGV